MVGLHVVDSSLYHLFQGDTRPFDPAAKPGPPSPERIQKVAQLITTHGGWLGSPEDNAAIGLRM